MLRRSRGAARAVPTSRRFCRTNAVPMNAVMCNFLTNPEVAHRGINRGAECFLPCAGGSTVERTFALTYRLVLVVVLCDDAPRMRARQTERPGQPHSGGGICSHRYHSTMGIFLARLALEKRGTPTSAAAKRWVRVRPVGSTGAGILLARAVNEKQLVSVGKPRFAERPCPSFLVEAAEW
jgi:hypothetical protein